MSSDAPSTDPRASLPAAIAAVAGATDLDTALAAILDAAATGLGSSFGAIFLADPDRPGLSLAASSGVADTSGLAAGVSDPADPFTTAATDRTARFDRAAVMGDGGSYVGAYLPLMVASGGVEACVGSIGFAWPAPHVVAATERDVLTALAALAALGVERARLGASTAERSEWFERMAHTDALTGLANERTVSRILELELARAGRQGGEVSLALFDIDDFRAANAADGHEAGDDMLRRVAAVLAESVRLVDTVGRIGGDEFVLVAPGAAGGTVARRVLDGIAALPAAAGRTVSVSAGVARFPTDASDAEGLIAAATDALGRAKGSGAGSVAETAAAVEG